MKNQIYFFILGFLIVVSSLILLLYFTQDFTEEIKIYDAINFDNIELTNQDSNMKQMGSVYATIGTIELENNGIFAQSYQFPKIIGCLNNPELSQYEKQAYFFFTKDQNSQVEYYSLRYQEQEPIEIKVGETENFFIRGTLDPNKNLETLKKTKSILIYQIDPKAENPIDFNKYTNYYNACDSLSIDKQPIKEIILIY